MFNNIEYGIFSMNVSFTTRGNMMKYSEIYSTDFINKVNEIKSEAATGIIADQEITKNFIDIEDMLKQLGFSIIKDDHLGLE